MLRISALFLLVLALENVLSQEGTYCQTPLQDPGLCINIKRCDGLITLLRTQSANPEVRNYLQRSTCGYDGNTPLVCCPQINSQFGTTASPPPPVTAGPQPIPTGPPPRATTQTPVTHLPVVQPPIIDNGDPILRPPNCGFSNRTNSRVVGGVPAKLGEFPWAVVLGYRNSKNPNQPKWLCGGSLISDRHILTAGHCVFNRQDLYVARLGELDLYSDDDGASPVQVPIIRAKVHENYSPQSFTNDIAILTLEYKPNTPTVWPICLPADNPLRTKNFEKYTAFVAGWGALYFNGPSSPTLQTAQIEVVPTPQCKNAFAMFPKQVIDERVLCAGVSTGAMDACQGDSGGPLMLGRTENDNKRFYQLGVVSYGFRCAEPGYPGVYTRITHFIDWIRENIR